MIASLLMGDGFLQDGEKLKLEESFITDVASFKCDTIPAIPDNLQRISKTMYVSDNGFYESETVRNVSFYERSFRRYSPVCSASYPVESVMNLMTGHLQAGNYTVSLTQHLYGYRTASSELPLSSLLAFCLGQGCVPYVGISDSGPEIVKGTLFMVNGQRGFCHTFKFEISSGVFETGGGTVSVDAYTYTPIHNLAK